MPSPVGMPGRALRNSFAERAIANSPDLEKRCLTSCLHVCRCRDTQETYCIARALDRASQGDVENGLIFAGSNAGRAQQIIPVAELMQELTTSL
ncbi:nitronate monooxygenase [Acaryochloris sp. IP29b_bin.137]|uniref:nitronate monooxygenase n=1 Tax=Acaryochloris sp. IP29b_bin.137 TaxID=2969217 RepID=UPI00261362FF|nr:nitronate monooxygenase [Acaryochloris sp. IP29b_bin.137]